MASPWFYPTNKIRLSHSSVTTYEKCHRKWEFFKLLRLYSRYEHIAMECGHALHQGMQTFMRTGNREAAMLAMMLAYPIELCTDPMDDRSLEACYATLAKMMDHNMLGRQQLAQVKCLDGEVRGAIEVPFIINFKNFHINTPDGRKLPVEYVGFIDAIMFAPMEQAYMVLDIKTTRDRTTDLSGRYFFDGQPLPYGLILQQMTGVALQGFNVQYLSAYIDLQKPEASLYSVPKTIVDVQDWLRSMLFILNELKWQTENMWFRRTQDGYNCQGYNNKKCPAIDFCQSRDAQKTAEYIELSQGANPWQEKEVIPWMTLDVDVEAIRNAA